MKQAREHASSIDIKIHMGRYLPILVTPNMEMIGLLRHAASAHPLRNLHLLVKPDYNMTLARERCGKNALFRWSKLSVPSSFFDILTG